jgi:hypothetical protein
MAEDIEVILATRKVEYFCNCDWTANVPNSLAGKSARLIDRQADLAGLRRGPCLTLPAHGNRAFIVPW